MGQVVKRRPDWPERLAALITERRAQPFVWGVHDCCLFAADVVKAMTGHDPAAPYRGTYSTQEGAAKVLANAGGVFALVDATLGHGQRIPVRLAKRGDLVFVDTEQGVAVGVVTSDHAVFAAPDGLTQMPLSRCRDVAYRVPE